MGLLFSSPWSFAKLSWTCRAQRSDDGNCQLNRLAFMQPTAQMSSCLRRKFHRLAPGHHLTGDPSRPSALTIKNGRFVEVLWCCARPISCRASGGVAIAAQRNPFFSSQYVADTDRFLGVGLIDRATLIEAPRPRSTVRARKDFLTLLELFQRKRRVHRADAMGIGAGLDGAARHRGHARTLFHSAKANCFSWVIRLRYAQSRCTKRILMFA